MRWVGIDEAGYGPNLGPMVMTAVIAESTNETGGQPVACTAVDFWNDLAGSVDRAGGDRERVWIDDSKAILRGGKGRERLEIACLAAIHAFRNELPGCVGELVAILGAGSLAEIELDRWNEPVIGDRVWPPTASSDALDAVVACRPFAPAVAAWRIASLKSVVVGPARFNGGLAVHGSKAAVHFEAFDRLLKQVWDRAGDGGRRSSRVTNTGVGTITCGRFRRPSPTRGSIAAPESPDLSQYTIRDREPKARADPDAARDQHDGLVALASIVSKTVRELWMDVFNRVLAAASP